MLFGFLFGSVFGFEDVIPALWLRPVSAMTSLPFIGQLNTVFVVAVAFGMALNLLAMLFQIINALRAHDTDPGSDLPVQRTADKSGEAQSQKDRRGQGDVLCTGIF